jgi:hypothetical protein
LLERIDEVLTLYLRLNQNTDAGDFRCLLRVRCERPNDSAAD